MDIIHKDWDVSQSTRQIPADPTSLATRRQKCWESYPESEPFVRERPVYLLIGAEGYRRVALSSIICKMLQNTPVSSKLTIPRG